MTVQVKKIEKNEQNHEISFVFLPIPQTSDRLTFFSIFDTIQQMQVIMHTAIHPGGWLVESFFRPFFPLIFWHPYFEIAQLLNKLSYRQLGKPEIADFKELWLWNPWFQGFQWFQLLKCIANLCIILYKQYFVNNTQTGSFIYSPFFRPCPRAIGTVLCCRARTFLDHCARRGTLIPE